MILIHHPWYDIQFKTFLRQSFVSIRWTTVYGISREQIFKQESIVHNLFRTYFGIYFVLVPKRHRNNYSLVRLSEEFVKHCFIIYFIDQACSTLFANAISLSGCNLWYVQIRLDFSLHCEYI